MIYSILDSEVNNYVSLVRESIKGKNLKVGVITFGCQQNERDSERILGLAVEMGYTPVDDVDSADLIVINTCAIREHAEVKALSMLGRFKALKKLKPDMILGVVGCMAAEEHRARMLKEDFHYVSFTLEPGMLHKIPELVAKKIIDGKRSFIFGDDKGDIYEGIPSVRASNHRAWVSIMYGCNNFCSYCIVPYVRGRERSRRSEDVLAECRSLIKDGIKEITLLGQNVNSYSDRLSFPQLLKEIAEIPGDFIIRFMTSHPKDTSLELIDVMAQYSPKIAPFFHLPLQSGSNSILKAMNRTYTREKYIDIAMSLREKIPDIALSTDVIVGFPGESDEDFADTMEILEKVRFDNVYAFNFSPREGTRAARMENTVPKNVMNKRLSHLLSVQERISLERNTPLKDRIERVLTDSVEIREGRTVWCGRTLTNKLVYFDGDAVSIGKFINVKIEKACPYHLIGSVQEQKED